MDKNLIEIADKYSSKRDFDDLKGAIYKLYQQYIRGHEQTLMEAVAASAAVNALFLSDQIDLSKVTPQIEEAWRLAYPNVELSSLAGKNPEEVEGFLSAWKGKHFEVTVRDELNAGNAVGDIQLESGQVASLAESSTQPGWDLQILNADGTIAEELQLKATESLSYVQSALEKYPDIDVLTTSEVFESAENVSGQIFNSGISDNAIAETIQEPMEALLDTPFGELVEDVLPGLPFILITVSEGRHVIMGRKSFEIALSSAVERGIKTGAAIGVGALIALMDGGLLSIPAAFFTRVGIDRYKIMNRNIKQIDANITTLQRLLPLYR